MTRPSWNMLGWIVALGAVVWAAWYFLPRADSTTAISLSEVQGKVTSEQLTITYVDCSRDGDVQFVETDTSVTITVRIDWTSKLDCPNETATESIVLAADLGDRLVIDGSNGSTMELLPPE